ncbi:hypothetical protein IFM89_002293 [Coptis chinensis]|uniref:JmjC domain-containing protein n=1 Tax=Coptis chinensis TaxID=261450 RepID=A0A835IN27_9MAGN|nr:hypothetical protein IFM89_002293 [Coptis chinensis]
MRRFWMQTRVVLWPPTAIPSLYPMPIYGEASNHSCFCSSVDLVNPDYSTHSRAKFSSDYSQKVTLHAGDALFIPEGWFHQVDSDDLTIAVNYWWQSSIMSSMSEHMDAYYLRRVMRSTVSHVPSLEIGQDRMLHGASICNEKSEKHVGKKLAVGEIGYQEFDSVDQNGTKVTKAANQKEKIMLDQLKPSALQALHELVSLVHDSVNVNVKIQPVPSTSTGSPSESRSGESKKIASVNLFLLEDDPVADIVWTLKPLELQNVLLAMVYNFPRTLETLILHVLSPVGAEVLTRKFEEIDQQIIIEERNEFYQIFYGVFDDQFAAMDSILNGKESFALQAFRNVLDKYLGVNFDGPKQ